MRTLVSRGLIGSIFNTRNDLRVEEERMDCSALSIMTRRLSNHEEKLPISVLVDYPIDGDGPTYIMTSTTLGLLRLSLPSFAELPSTPIVVLYTRRVCPYPTIQFTSSSTHTSLQCQTQNRFPSWHPTSQHPLPLIWVTYRLVHFAAVFLCGSLCLV